MTELLPENCRWIISWWSADGPAREPAGTDRRTCLRKDLTGETCTLMLREGGRQKERQTGLKQERGSLHWSQAGIGPPLSCRAALFLCSIDSHWSCKDSPMILAEMTASQVNCRFTVSTVMLFTPNSDHSIVVAEINRIRKKLGDKVREVRLRWCGGEIVIIIDAEDEATGGRKRVRLQRRDLAVGKEDVQKVGVTEEDGGDRVRWRPMNWFADP